MFLSLCFECSGCVISPSAVLAVVESLFPCFSLGSFGRCWSFLYVSLSEGKEFPCVK